MFSKLRDNKPVVYGALLCVFLASFGLIAASYFIGMAWLFVGVGVFVLAWRSLYLADERLRPTPTTKTSIE